MEQVKINESLHQAALNLDNHEIKRLLKAGADINYKNQDGLNAFDLVVLTHEELERNSKSTLRLLVSHGIDINSLDNKGLSTGHKLVFGDNISSYYYLRATFDLDPNIHFGKSANLTENNILDYFIHLEITNNHKPYKNFCSSSFLPDRAKEVKAACDDEHRKLLSPWSTVARIAGNSQFDWREVRFIFWFPMGWLRSCFYCTRDNPEQLDRLYFTGHDLMQILDHAGAGANEKLDWLYVLLGRAFSGYPSEMHFLSPKGRNGSQTPTKLIRDIQNDLKLYDENEKERIFSALTKKSSTALTDITAIFNKHLKAFKLVM